jgi:hypothetical protein
MSFIENVSPGPHFLLADSGRGWRGNASRVRSFAPREQGHSAERQKSFCSSSTLFLGIKLARLGYQL